MSSGDTTFEQTDSMIYSIYDERSEDIGYRSRVVYRNLMFASDLVTIHESKMKRNVQQAGRR